jgi:hypothetical protein
MTDAPARSAPGESSGPPPRGGSRGASSPIEQLIRSVAAIAAIFYVFGFLTTNSYLYKIGVSDFSLLRTRFILTGVLTLAPLAIALIWGLYAAVDVALQDENGLPGPAFLWILGDVAIPFVLYFVLFSVVADNDILTSALDAILLSATCAVVVFVLLGSLSYYRRTNRRPISYFIKRGKPITYERFTEHFGIPDIVVETMFFAVGGPLLLLAYIGFFGWHFYGELPEQIGGGRPRTAQLLISSSAVAAARNLGIDVTEESPLSPPLELLWEGEDSYVVRLPSPHQKSVAQLSRGLVDGVVTQEPLPPADETP